MIVIGYFALWCAFFFSLFSCGMSIWSFFNQRNTIIQNSRYAIIACFSCVFLASCTLWYAIFYHDFSVKYVFEHSAYDMPPFYLFTSFWSALEGSHLLWTLLLSSVCAFVVLITSIKEQRRYLSTVCFIFSVCLLFMLLLNLTVSKPFTRMDMVHAMGLGMNALLQNPYMAIHPPMLFLGYSLLIVPFAYAFSALITGTITSGWLVFVRKFTLVAWAVLTVAIFLGGKWAYVVLGWGGYWAWDPVENASFMPWLATTAFLHTALIYERTKKLPRLMIFLGMLSFILTFFGTFLTRSGVISSVHSFAQSSIGPAYLLWIFILCFVTIFLVFNRGFLLQTPQTFEPFKFSKEAILLFTNYFLLFLLSIVLFGTILPLIVEALTGTKISIQQPFYNAFAPWIGIVLVGILGVGNVAKWRSARIEHPWISLYIPLCVSLSISIFTFVIKHISIRELFIYFFVLWTILVLIGDCFYKLKELNWNARIFLKNQRSYLGALIIHIGFLTAILGFSGYSKTFFHEVDLPLHQSVQFAGFYFQNQGLTYQQHYNEKRIAAVIETKPLQANETEFLIKPARTKYTNNEQWFNDVGIHSTLWFDLYLVLTSFDIQNQSVTLKIGYHPMVKFVWTSVVIMVLGALFALTSRVNFRKSRRHAHKKIFVQKKQQHQQKTSSFLIILALIGITIFSLSGTAFAQTTTTLEDVGHDLRCPTCLGMSILESDTPQSIAMRTEVEQMIKDGKNKQEIIAYFKEHYGSWILREPDSGTTLGKVLWGIPIVGFVAGPFLLLWRLYKKSSV